MDLRVILLDINVKFLRFLVNFPNNPKVKRSRESLGIRRERSKGRKRGE